MSYNSRRNTIFVYNLDVHVSEADFLSHFRKRYYGSVKNGEIVQYSKNDKLFRYGIINFVDSASAKKAVRDKNYLNGEKIVCKYASIEWKDQNAPQKSEEPQHLRSIYVSNLNISVTSHHLIDYFPRFGPIVNARIMQDEYNISVGYGFVEFYCSSSVKEVQEKRPHRILNQYVQTARTYPKDVPTHLKKPTTILYVYNYERHTNEKHIEKYFSQFGRITLVSRKETRPENIKFMKLQFEDYDAVDKICLMDNHKINNCHTIKVSKYLGDSIEKLAKAKTKTGTEMQKITKTAANFKSNMNRLKSSKNRSNCGSTPYYAGSDPVSWSSANDSPFSQRGQSSCESTPNYAESDPVSCNSDNDSPFSQRGQSSCESTPNYAESDPVSCNSDNDSPSSRRGQSTPHYAESDPVSCNSDNDSPSRQRGQSSCESTPHYAELDPVSCNSDNDSPSSRRGSTTEKHSTEKLTIIKTRTETQKITKPAADFKSNTNQLKSTENQYIRDYTPHFTKRDSLSCSSDNGSSSSRRGSRTETFNTNNECELGNKGRHCEVDMVTKRLDDGTEKLASAKKGSGTEKQKTTKPDSNSKSNTAATFTFGEQSSTLIQSIASNKRKRSTSSVERNPKSSKPTTQPTAKNFPSQDRPHQTSSSWPIPMPMSMPAMPMPRRTELFSRSSTNASNARPSCLPQREYNTETFSDDAECW